MSAPVTGRTPRLVVNALPLDPHGGGVSTYIRELLVALPPVVGATVAAAVQSTAVGELPSDVEPLVQPPSRGVRRALSGLRGFGAADLVHGLDVDLPLGPRVPMVSTVHDMALYDIPSVFPRHRVVGERLLVQHALRRADAVIAVSAFTAERVKARFGRDAVVVHEAPGAGMVVPSAGDVERVRTRYRLPETFVLHVGNIEPRKDLATLAEGCRRVDVPLLLTGAPLWGHRQPRGTTTLGHVDRSDLPALFAAATVVGYASRYEGFGLPPVEALACGAAVVSTPVPALAEVVGDVVDTFPPGDADALERILRRLLADGEERSARAEAGRARLAGLSWERAARETASVYRSIGASV
ncbi:MAG: glycosyltransferase family 1 protein [Actinomycetota bacterium]|nr:glycosyltransferase family 1 protein [Actinomycetota bacterium]